MRKINGAGGINLPNFTLYYKATVIKTVWYWQKNRPMEKDREPEMNPHTYGYLRIYSKAETASSISAGGKT